IARPRISVGARRGRLAVLLLLGALASAACSLIVNRSTDQCQMDGDCKPYGAYSVCNQGVCVMPESMHDSGGAGGGCFMGTPTTDLDFFNACTDAGCEPFDNCARVGLCDAGLPKLIVPPDGGV